LQDALKAKLPLNIVAYNHVILFFRLYCK